MSGENKSTEMSEPCKENGGSPLAIGSAEHKDLLCRFFIDTHKPFEPEDLPWPEVTPEVRERLSALPIWNEAVTTEAETAAKVMALAKVEADPLLREAVRLQGYEEERHSRLLRILVERYDIDCKPRPMEPLPADPNWGFMRGGYGECFDSFFAFGLFALARDSGFFTPELVELFEPVMQEEGRHIIFHVNWIAYCQAQLPFMGRPSYVFRRALAVALNTASRIRTAAQIGREKGTQDNFTMTAHASFGDFSLPQFIKTCIAENDKRLAPYDRRLLRPSFMPALAKQMLRVVPGKKLEPI